MIRKTTVSLVIPYVSIACNGNPHMSIAPKGNPGTQTDTSTS